MELLGSSWRQPVGVECPMLAPKSRFLLLLRMSHPTSSSWPSLCADQPMEAFVGGALSHLSGFHQ